MAHYISHKSLRQKMTQVIVFALLVLAGIAFGPQAEAQLLGRKSNKPMKIAQQKSSRICYILYKKRTKSQNRSVMASARSRRPKYKPMAETDQPVRLASLN